MFGQGIPVKRSSRQTMIKLYAQAVISELQQLGYPNSIAVGHLNRLVEIYILKHKSNK